MPRFLEDLQGAFVYVDDRSEADFHPEQLMKRAPWLLHGPSKSGVARDIHAQASKLFGLTVLRLSCEESFPTWGLHGSKKRAKGQFVLKLEILGKHSGTAECFLFFLYNSDPQGIFLQEQSCPSASNLTVVPRPPCFVALWTPDHALII